MPEDPHDRRQQLLIQVDGLSKPILDAAIRAGHAPNLAALANHPDYILSSLYSGLPSTTPAAQAELFYAVRSAVPAFAYLHDRKTARLMLEPSAADSVERALECERTGLLRAGASYCNIYTGGAEVSRFCPAAMARQNRAVTRGFAHRLRTWGGNLGVGLRSGVMLLAEFTRILMEGRNDPDVSFTSKIRDSWDRILMSVALRDSSRLSALHDIRRGVPVIHVNFLGYDKQAHRYAPDSPPALRALRGIDTAIGSLIDEIRRRENRSATIVVYSDHGQEAVRSVRSVLGKPIDQIIRDVLRAHTTERSEHQIATGQAVQSKQQSRSIVAKVGDELLGTDAVSITTPDGSATEAVVIESGSLAHIYFVESLPASRREKLAQSLAHEIPGVAVAFRNEKDGYAMVAGESAPMTVLAFCEHRLSDHPFYDRLDEDLETMLSHPDAGDIVLFGTIDPKRAITFAEERGAHGGIGSNETHAFLIIPRRLHNPSGAGDAALRMADLRDLLVVDRGERDDS